MKNIYYYAEKNGLSLFDTGDCQLCGSQAKRGIFECHENFCLLSEKLDFSDPVNHLSRFLCVDAMALQHPEVHGPGSNHLHLTRLYLILVDNNLWTYKKTPQLSDTFNAIKAAGYDPLIPPAVKNRGELTSYDVASVNEPREIIHHIRSWAETVFHAYQAHHPAVAKIAAEFLRTHY